MNENRNETANSTTPRSGEAAKATPANVDVISSRELLGRNKRLSIEHNGECYTLRITSNNKLILTK